MYDTLLSIGASDIETIDCEVDSIDVTFKVTTETKRLWVFISGKYSDEWYVESIRDYDDHDIYYYVTDRSIIYEERIYSYLTGEIIHEPTPGSSLSYPIVLNISTLVADINADIESAKEKYNGQALQITGTITFISDSAGMTGYYLYGTRGGEGLKVTCWVDDRDNKSLSVGQTVTFLGYMREVTIMNNTEIGDCTIVTPE